MSPVLITDVTEGTRKGKTNIKAFCSNQLQLKNKHCYCPHMSKHKTINLHPNRVQRQLCSYCAPKKESSPVTVSLDKENNCIVNVISSMISQQAKFNRKVIN